jgi:hypothetical protein
MRLAFVLLLAGCASGPAAKGGGGGGGGSQHGHAHTPLDEKTPLTMSGPRCAGGACTCRDVDDFGRAPKAPEADVAPGTKRFELRTGRGQDPMVLALEGHGALHKALDKVDATCGYVDLAPGKYALRFRAVANSAEAGMVPAFFIREYGARTQDWYDTFAFRCGAADACSIGHMEEWNERLQKVARGIHDPCGSVRVEGVRWNVERQVGVKLAELVVEFTLEVYKFPPRFPHGTKTCKGPGGVSADEVEDAPAK